MSKVLKFMSMFSFVFVSIISANEVQYIALPTTSNGDGSWQMVGVAGFDEDEYRIDIDDSNKGLYTAWYCEDSRIKIKENLDKDDIKSSNGIYKYLLFAIKIDNPNIGSFTINTRETKIKCTSGYNTGNSAPIDLLVTLKSNLEDGFESISSGEDLTVLYPNSFKNATIKFFVNDSPKEVFGFSLDSASNTKTIVVNGDSSDISVEELYTITKPIEETVDLYLNDNPGFGNLENKNSNYKRAKSEYNPKYHRIPLHATSDNQQTLLSKNSTLRIYSYNSKEGVWEFYNSDDKSSVNRLTELQVGRGYWMKLDNKLSDVNNYFFTLELNSSYYNGESNITIENPSSNKTYDINFSKNTADIIVKTIENNSTDINDTLGSDLKVTKVSDNSILLISNIYLNIKEKTEEQDAFLNVEKENSIGFTKLKNLKSGLVLGDSHIKLKNHEIYSAIGSNGWNLLTLPTATIRESVTGLIVDKDYLDDDNLQIFNTFKTQIVTVAKGDLAGDVNDSALAINQKIAQAIRDEVVSGSFNIRAYPIKKDDEDKVLFISDDKFSIIGPSEITYLDGNTSAKDGSSKYGEYVLTVEKNFNSPFVKQKKAKIVFGLDYEKPIDNNGKIKYLNEISDIKKDTLPLDVKQYILDQDFNGTGDDSNFLLFTSQKPFSIKDVTFTRTFVFKDYNGSKSGYINVYDGTSDALNISPIEIPKNTNISTSNIVKELNNSISEITAVSEDNYLFIMGTVRHSSTQEDILMSNLDIKESQDNEEDILEDTPFNDKNASKGALLRGYQGSLLSKVKINDNGTVDFTKILDGDSVTTKLSINDVTAVPFRTLDLMSENALITLSDPEGLNKIPTMIIGSETNNSTGTISWRTLNVTRTPSKWYENYDLFSTNNQKSYWVYLVEPTDQKPIEILGVTSETDPQAPKIKKRYLRHFNNETGEVFSYPSISVKATVDKILNGNTVEGYVGVSLLNGGSELSKKEFVLSNRTQNIFSGYINSLDVEEYIKDINVSEGVSKVEIKATDGRTYTDRFLKDIDLKKPHRPELEFSDTMGDLTIKSEKDVDVVKYLIFKNAIDDLTGINVNDTLNAPTNFLLSVPASGVTTTVNDMCKYISNTNEFQAIKLLVMALDNEDETQSNVSYMERINYIPFKNVHVLIAKDSNLTKTPIIYGDDCQEKATDIKDFNGGVQFSSDTGEEVRLVYKPIDGVGISTAKVITMRLSIDNGDLIASLDFSNNYEGQTFFIYQQVAGVGKLYKGKFTKGHDSTSTAYKLSSVKSGSFINTTAVSDQRIGSK